MPGVQRREAAAHVLVVRHEDKYWKPSRVPRDADIDEVGRILLGTGPKWNGLCVAASAVAAWERITDSRERVLARRSPRAVAAAVDRLVAYRAAGVPGVKRSRPCVPSPGSRPASIPGNTSSASRCSRAPACMKSPSCIVLQVKY